jgi:predicted GTPase
MTDYSNSNIKPATDKRIAAWESAAHIMPASDFEFVISIINRVKTERKNNTDCALAYHEGYLMGLKIAGEHGRSADKLLQKICEDVEREYQAGGLSSGIYGDYAKDVALRYTAALSEGYEL